MLEIQYSILHGVFQNLQKKIFRTCGTLAYYNKNIQTQFIVNLEIKRKIFVYEPLVIIIQCARYQFCLCIWNTVKRHWFFSLPKKFYTNTL